MKLQKILRISLAVFLHIFGWGAFFLLPNIVFDIPFTKVHFKWQWQVWLIIIMLFYFNYYVLFPKLFKKRLFPVYLLSLIFCIYATYKTSNYVGVIARQKYERPMPPRMHQGREFRQSDTPRRGQGPEKTPWIKRRSNIGLLYIMLIVSLAGTMIRVIQLWIKNESLLSENEKNKLITELAYLKSQINPHFLFNSLNSIYSLSLKKSDDTPDVILKLSGLLRYMLYETSADKVDLNKEVEHLRDYIDLQRIRLGANSSLDVLFVGEFSKFKIEPLLFVPIIENVFKHGITNTAQNEIKIELKLNDNVLTLKTDNPVRSKGNLPVPSGGIGLSNITRRLQLSYPNKHKFEYNNINERFVVLLELNLENSIS